MSDGPGSGLCIGAQGPIQNPWTDGQTRLKNITFATPFDLFSSVSMFSVFSVSSTATGAEPKTNRLSARRPQ